MSLALSRCRCGFALASSSLPSSPHHTPPRQWADPALSALRKLYVNGNDNLVGTIPSTLFTLNLTVLDLSNNKQLTGALPCVPSVRPLARTSSHGTRG